MKESKEDYKRIEEMDKAIRKAFTKIKSEISAINKQLAELSAEVKSLKKESKPIKTRDLEEIAGEIHKKLEKKIELNIKEIKREKNKAMKDLKADLLKEVKKKAEKENIIRLNKDIEKLDTNKVSLKEFYKQNYTHVQEIIALGERMKVLEELYLELAKKIEKALPEKEPLSKRISSWMFEEPK